MSLFKKTQSNIASEEPILTTLDYVLLTIFILFMASAASFLVNKALIVFIFLGIVAIFFSKKRRLNKKAVYLWGVWFLINILALVLEVSSQHFVFSSFLGLTLRLIMPFFIVSLIGPSFFSKLNKYIFVLVCISTILFLVDIIFPGLFPSLAPRLNFMTAREQKVKGGFYLFFYMHSAWAEVRNCGFMWEPGAFAAILVFMLSYRFSVNGFKVDKYIIVYLLALLTTVSTAGFLALFLISLAYMLTIKKHILFYYLIVIPLFLWFSYNYYKSSEFLFGKIEYYQQLGSNTWEWEFEEQSVVRVSRVGIALITLEESLHWPFGFGASKSDYTLNKYGNISGPNSLATILHQWGWPGLLFIIYIIFWFFRRNTEQTPSLLFTIAFCIVLFSNPFLLKYLVYSLPYFYFLYGKNIRYKQSSYQTHKIFNLKN